MKFGRALAFQNSISHWLIVHCYSYFHMGHLKKPTRMSDDLNSVLKSVIFMDIFKVKSLMNWFPNLGSET